MGWLPTCAFAKGRGRFCRPSGSPLSIPLRTPRDPSPFLGLRPPPPTLPPHPIPRLSCVLLLPLPASCYPHPHAGHTFAVLVLPASSCGLSRSLQSLHSVRSPVYLPHSEHLPVPKVSSHFWAIWSCGMLGGRCLCPLLTVPVSLPIASGATASLPLPVSAPVVGRSVRGTRLWR